MITVDDVPAIKICTTSQKEIQSNYNEIFNLWISSNYIVKNNDISRIKKDGYKLCTQEVHKIGKRMYSVLRGTLHHHTIVTIFVYNESI